MLFFRSEIDYKYCPLSENSISEVFQRFKSEIEDFVFLFHEKSDISPFCLTTLTAYSLFWWKNMSGKRQKWSFQIE